MPQLLRKLGVRDAALIVMGGIIGSGIFMNPSRVANYVHTTPLIMLAWIAGGGIALLGAGVFAELAARRPHDGGLYAYVRDAFHPSLAFLYGWTLLLVSQSGGAAASAVTFATYFEPLTGIHVDPKIIAIAVIALFTIINCLGVREGTSTQNGFMIAKIAAIAGLIIVGVIAALVPHANALHAVAAPAQNLVFMAFGIAMVQVLFAYSGWQTSSFMSAELRDTKTVLPRGMLIGVLGVVVLYLGVNIVCILALGPDGLAATKTPASAIAQLVFGPVGAKIMAGVIALSTLGFISNQILTSPRVYFQMAADGIFFKQIAHVSPRTHVPIIAIALQGIVAILIALAPAYDQIVDYVTSVDYVFFGLCALALFVFRARDRRNAQAPVPPFRIPLHPWSTGLFMVIAWTVVLNLLISKPADTLAGLGILLSGFPVYWLFTKFNRTPGVREPDN